MIPLDSPIDPRVLSALATPTTLDSPLWRFDGISIVLLVLVVGIAAAVVPFAHRSLRGDRHGIAVTIAIGAMLAATAWLAVAGPLWMLGLAWSVSTIATLVALGLGGGVRAVLPGGVWLLAADAALWAAVLLMALGTSPDAVAILLAIAATLRCALPPAQSWLVGSLYAPTPVSAALHGGIVNGGGILVITQLPIIGASSVATTLLAIVSAVGLLVGITASLVRTDIKGRLVMSTVAQMGFMLLCAALGLAAAALVHLVAHGLYKSSLFLASSDGVDRRAYDRRAPVLLALTRRLRILRSTAGAALPVASLAAVALTLYPGGRGVPELLLLIVIGSAFAAAGARAALLAPSTALAAVSTAALAAGAAAYALAASLLSAVLTPAATTAATPAVLIIAVLTAGLVVSLGIVSRWFPLSSVGLAVQALGLSAGQAGASTRRPPASPERAWGAPEPLAGPVTTGAPS
ncbi:MAG: proton-conducting transporter membrane subunit [Microcella sp.]|uniref:proton-conducting transporter transmembrane domain-containing protein n=1 Tax=Microcella sp. TaxID=1913979 RepID=UPI00331529C2